MHSFLYLSKHIKGEAIPTPPTFLTSSTGLDSILFQPTLQSLFFPLQMLLPQLPSQKTFILSSPKKLFLSFCICRLNMFSTLLLAFIVEGYFFKKQSVSIVLKAKEQILETLFCMLEIWQSTLCSGKNGKVSPVVIGSMYHIHIMYEINLQDEEKNVENNIIIGCIGCLY